MTKTRLHTIGPIVGALLLIATAGCRDAQDAQQESSPPHTTDIVESLPILSDKPEIVSEPSDRPTRMIDDPDELGRRIDLAAQFLVRSCGPDGQFVYRVNLDPSVTPSPRYNIVRHAGALYAMGMYYERSGGEEVRQAMLRAGKFLRDKCMWPPAARPDLLAIWSTPEIEFQGEEPEAKLGGTGLGLVGLMSLEKVSPGATPIEELRRLGRFLAYMQDPDGSFYTKYLPSEGGRWREWVSLYYPGEAALGFLMLYEADPDLAWLDAAGRAIGYLTAIRYNQPIVPADHWALLATAKLLPVYDRVELPVSREAIVGHAIQICDFVLHREYPIHTDPALVGCCTIDGRTCPTATRLEGLQAALEVLPPEHAELRAEIEDYVDDAMTFLLSTQVTTGPYSGGIPRAIRRLPANFPLPAIDEFNERSGEVRIDYVQHAMSGMIQYERRMQAEGE